MGSEIDDHSTANAQAEPDHRKPCTLCSKLCNVRIRCQIDETSTWHLVCPGKCWRSVSGGVIDGDGDPAHRFYRYGGVWRNKHDVTSGKRPKKSKNTDAFDSTASSSWTGQQIKYTKNDRVLWDGEVWICRKSHESNPSKPPPSNPSAWKEAVGWKEEG